MTFNINRLCMITKNTSSFKKTKKKFLIMTGQGLVSFPDLGKNSEIEILDLSNNPIDNFETLPTIPSLKYLTLDSTEIYSFYRAQSQPSLTKLSIQNTPLSKYQFINIMTIIVYGFQINQVNKNFVSKNELKIAFQMADFLRPYLLRGWILVGIDKIQLFHPLTHQRMTLKLRKEANISTYRSSQSFSSSAKHCSSKKKNISKFYSSEKENEVSNSIKLKKPYLFPIENKEDQTEVSILSSKNSKLNLKKSSSKCSKQKSITSHNNSSHPIQEEEFMGNALSTQSNSSINCLDKKVNSPLIDKSMRDLDNNQILETVELKDQKSISKLQISEKSEEEETQPKSFNEKPNKFIPLDPLTISELPSSESQNEEFEIPKNLRYHRVSLLKMDSENEVPKPLPNFSFISNISIPVDSTSEELYSISCDDQSIFGSEYQSEIIPLSESDSPEKTKDTPTKSIHKPRNSILVENFLENSESNVDEDIVFPCTPRKKRTPRKKFHSKGSTEKKLTQLKINFDSSSKREEDTYSEPFYEIEDNFLSKEKQNSLQQQKKHIPNLSGENLMINSTNPQAKISGPEQSIHDFSIKMKK